MSERRRTARFGEFSHTESERLALMDDWDENEYLRDQELRWTRRHHPCIPHEGPEASEAERIQSPESAQ